MSRKHFESLAASIRGQLDAIRNARVGIPGEDIKSAMLSGATSMAHAVANACADANPSFDRNRFLKACGVAL